MVHLYGEMIKKNCLPQLITASLQLESAKWAQVIAATGVKIEESP